MKIGKQKGKESLKEKDNNNNNKNDEHSESKGLVLENQRLKPGREDFRGMPG